MSEVERELAELERAAPDLGSLDAMPTPLGVPPSPLGGRDEGRSRGSTAALLGTLAVLVVGLAIPVSSMLLALATTIYSMVGELLEVTGGLDRGLFDSARLWATLVNGAVLGWCVVRRARRGSTGSAWAPLVALWLGYLAALWVLIPLDLYSEWDVSDPLTTFFLVGAAMLIGPGLLLLALEMVLRALRAGWRSAGRSEAGRRRVLVGSALIGTTLMSLTAVGFVASTRGYLGDALQPLGVEDDLDAMVTLEREWFVSASGALTPTAQGFDAGGETTRMVDCYEELTQHGFIGDAALMKATRRAMKMGLSDADATDLAWDALTRVCSHYAVEHIADLRAYYGRAVENALNDEHRRRMRTDEIAEALRRVIGHDGWPPLPERDRRVRQALDELDEQARRVIIYRLVDGYSHEQIGARLGKSRGAAAQVFSRARRQFIKRCEALNCREVR